MCIHACVCAWKPMCMHVCVCVSAHVCVCVCMCMFCFFVHVRMCVCLFFRSHVYICVCLRWFVCAYLRVHVCTCVFCFFSFLAVCFFRCYKLRDGLEEGDRRNMVFICGHGTGKMKKERKIVFLGTQNNFSLLISTILVVMR